MDGEEKEREKKVIANGAGRERERLPAFDSSFLNIRRISSEEILDSMLWHNAEKSLNREQMVLHRGSNEEKGILRRERVEGEERGSTVYSFGPVSRKKYINFVVFKEPDRCSPGKKSRE